MITDVQLVYTVGLYDHGTPDAGQLFEMSEGEDNEYDSEEPVRWVQVTAYSKIEAYCRALSKFYAEQADRYASMFSQRAFRQYEAMCNKLRKKPEFNEGISAESEKTG